MRKLNEPIINFFSSQNFVIVSTIDRNGMPHSSCKGILNIEGNGSVYLLDLYRGRTYSNLKRNPQISITAVDEHKFAGYCLKGKAKMIRTARLKPHLISDWESKITSRIAQRLIRNVQGEKGHPQHPEVLLPKPEYLIVMKVREIVDLTPHHIKQLAVK